MAFSPRAGAVITFAVEGAQTAQREIDTVGSAFDRMSSVASNGLKWLAAGLAALKLGAYLKDSTLLAARYETLGIVMRTAGANAGYSAAQMDSFDKSLEKSGISMMKSREAMIAMTTAGLDNNKALELGRLAQNLAVVANKNSSDALADLITNIQQADTEGLKSMGIILNQEEALQKYATAHGTVTKALTQTQKAEAIQAAVMQEGAKYAGIYEKAMGTAGKALSSLDRYFENIEVRLGTPFLEGFAQGVFGVTDGVKQLNKGLEALEKNGAMEKLSKSVGSSVGAVIAGIKNVIDVTGQIGSALVSVGEVAAGFFDKYLGGMDTVKGATIAFALLLSGYMVEQATIGFAALSAAAWASALKVGAAFVAMGAAAANMVRALQLSAALLGWSTTLVMAGRMAVTALGTVIAGIPGAVGAAVVTAGVGIGYLFAKAFGDVIERLTPKAVSNALNSAMEWLDEKDMLPGASRPSITAAPRPAGGSSAEEAAKAAANKAEKDRKEQLMRELNNSVVAAERQVNLTAATNIRLKALNEFRDQQLKQSLDQRIITQADYLQKKEKMDVAEAQGQLDQIAAQKAELATYMAAFKAGAPLGQGRDPAADANEMIKLSAEAAAAQTKVNAVKQSYAHQIAGAVLEGYTKEFGGVASLVDAQEELVRTSQLAYAVAGKTAEQQEIASALRMKSIAAELAAEAEQRRESGDATEEYLESAGAAVQALEQMGTARLKAVGKGVAAGFLNDTRAMAEQTVTLYGEMKTAFLSTDAERVKSAVEASTRLAALRLADANSAIDNTNDSDAQKQAAKAKILADYNRYVTAVTANAEAQVLQASTGFHELADAMSAAFDPTRIESFGDAMRDAFGSSGQAVGKLMDSLLTYDAQQQATTEARATAEKMFAGDKEKLARANQAISLREARDSLAYYGNLAGAAQGFFSENSKGYKAMQAAQQAFHAFELALAIRSALQKSGLIAGVTAAEVGSAATRTGVQAGATAASVTLAGTEASAWGITAVVKAIASLPFPLNLAAGAATLAAVVGIGAKMVGSLGGAGVSLAQQRQQDQGTGSVLGDSSAKSESIKRAIDAVEKNTYQDLAINSSMLATLRSIDSNIGNFASQLVRSTDITNPDVTLSSGVSGANKGTATLAALGYTAGSMVTLVGSVLGPLGALAGIVASKIPVVSKLMTSIFGGKQSLADSGITMSNTQLAEILTSGAKVNSYAEIKKSGGWFSKDKYNTTTTELDAAANAQITAVIKSMASSVEAAGNLLGLSGKDFTDKLGSFVVDIGKVSLKDLKGDELQKALEAVFSKLGDDMAQFAVGGLAGFQQVGEGYLETLVRIASEYQTVDVVFQSFGKTFGAVGLASVEARDRLVQLAGGLDEFTSQGEYFLTNFFSEKEQAAALRARIEPTLAKNGLSSSGADAAKMFRDFLVGLDTTTKAGAETWTELMAIAPALKSILDVQQKVLDERKDLQDQLDELTLTPKQLLDKQRAALDESNQALFDQVQAAKAAKDAAEKLAETQNSLLDLQGQIAELTGDKAAAAAVLEQQHAIALAALDPALRGATQKLWDLQAAAKAAEAVKTNASTLLGGVDSAFSVLQRVVDREKKAVQTTIDAHTAAVSKLQALSQSLHSTLDSLKSPDQKLFERAAGQAQIRSALAAVRAGGKLPEADALKNALSAVQQDATSQFADYNDYLRDLYQTQFDIGALAGLTDDSLSVEEKALDAAKKQLESLDGMLASAQAQIDVLKGIDITGLSIEKAIYALQGAITSANANPVVSSGAAINNAYQQYLGRAPDSAGMQWWQDQIAAGTSQSAVTDAIKNSAEANRRASIAQMYQQILGRKADDAGLGFFASNGSSLADIAAALKSSDEYKKTHHIPGFAGGGLHGGGLRIVGENGPELEATGPSRIWSSSQTTALLSRAGSGSNDALVAEVKALRDETRGLREEVRQFKEANSAENRGIAKGTQATAEHLDGVVNGQVEILTKTATVLTKAATA